MWDILNFVALVSILLVIIVALKKGSLGRTTYMGTMQQFVPTKDVTTVVPVPLHAATCDHDWETVTEQALEMPHEKKIVIIMSCHRCGIIDKTVQVTSPPPPPAPEPPCQHEWQTVIDQVLDVAHEKRAVVILTCRKCGTIDKTTEVTSKPPAPPAPQWTKANCKHDWDVEKKVVLESAYEQMLKSISVKQSYGRAKVDTEKRLDLDLNTAPAWMFRKSYVCVRVCKVCGEIDKIQTSNFDLAEGVEAGSEPWPEDTIKMKKETA